MAGVVEARAGDVLLQILLVFLDLHVGFSTTRIERLKSDPGHLEYFIVILYCASRFSLCDHDHEVFFADVDDAENAEDSVSLNTFQVVYFRFLQVDLTGRALLNDQCLIFIACV